MLTVPIGLISMMAFFNPPSRLRELITKLTKLLAVAGGEEPNGQELAAPWLIATSIQNFALEMWDLENDRKFGPIGLPGMPDGLAVSRESQESGFAVSAGMNVVTFHFPDRQLTLDGCGDLQALADGPTRYPIRVMQRNDLTLAESWSTGEILAVYPFPLDHIVMHPDGITWFGNYGQEVHILRLEGASFIRTPNDLPSRM